MKKFIVGLASFALLLGVATLFVPDTAFAVVVDPFAQCDTVDTASVSAVCGSRNDSGGDILENIVSVLLYVVGFLSVIVIIWGGLRYILSAGNSAQVASAKNTVLYGAIGLVISVLAIVIVNTVLNVTQNGTVDLNVTAAAKNVTAAEKVKTRADKAVEDAVSALGTANAKLSSVKANPNSTETQITAASVAVQEREAAVRVAQKAAQAAEEALVKAQKAKKEADEAKAQAEAEKNGETSAESLSPSLSN